MSSMLLPTERYALLIRQLGAELGNVRGWKKRVADRLGVHPSYVSRILSGEKLTIGPDVIDRACERLKLDVDFFFSEQAREPHYRGFVSETREQAARAGARRQEQEEARIWREAQAAALSFLRAASADWDPEAIRGAAAELLAVTRRIPLVRAAMGLERAITQDDADGTREEGWSLAGAVIVDASAQAKLARTTWPKASKKPGAGRSDK